MNSLAKEKLKLLAITLPVLVIVLLKLGVVLGICYIVLHFVMKFW